MSVSWPRFVRCTLGATALGAAAFLVPAQLRAESVPLAVTGQAAPGGGTYGGFSLVKLNDNGQVAFQAGTGQGFNDHGVFRAEETAAATLIARGGQSVGNGSITNMSFADINNLGQVLIDADLAGTSGGSADDRAIYVGSGGALKQMVREGAAFAPAGFFTTGMSGYKMTTLENLGFLEGTQLNDFGQVSFVGRYSAQEPIINGTVTVNRTAGMRANPDGTVSFSLHQGSSAPVAGGGTSGTIGAFQGAVPLPTKTAMIGNGGHTLYRTSIDATIEEGLFWTNNGFNPLKNKIRAVARNGQTLHPGAPGTIKVLSGSSPFFASHAVDMNDAGEVAFTAQLNAPAAGNWDIAVYRWSPTEAAVAGAHGLTEIARLGKPSPDGDGTIGNIFYAHVDLNNRRQAVFQSAIKNSTFGTGDNGIFLGDGQTLRNIARLSTKTPDGQRFIGLIGATVLANELGLNDAGQVAFMAPLRDNLGDFVGHGIYISDGIDMVEVARVGGKLGGSTVEGLSWVSERGINKYGQVAFKGDLENGKRGVFLYTLENLHWRSTAGGSWDANSNWTLSSIPGPVHHVHIDTAQPVTVTGPAANTVVENLTIGTFGGDIGMHKMELRPGVELSALNGIALNRSSVIDFEIAGPGAANMGRLSAIGNITARGVLEISLANGYQPLPGQLFDLMNADFIVGQFDSFNLPSLAPGQLWSKDRLYSDGMLVTTWQADFDEDGDVDDRDLALLKGGMGSTTATHRLGDANGDLKVNGLDFMTWQRQVGLATTLPALSDPDFAAVPEPATALLAALAGIAILPRRRR